MTSGPQDSDDKDEATNLPGQMATKAAEDNSQHLRILLGNVSSARIHGSAAMELGAKVGATVLMLTETRIRNEGNLIQIKAREAGYRGWFSDPRPLNPITGREGWENAGPK